MNRPIPLLLAAMAHAEDKPWPKTTHVYKTAGDVKLELDAYRPQDDQVRPVVVWFHGGAPMR